MLTAFIFFQKRPDLLALLNVSILFLLLFLNSNICCLNKEWGWQFTKSAHPNAVILNDQLVLLVAVV